MSEPTIQGALPSEICDLNTNYAPSRGKRTLDTPLEHDSSTVAELEMLESKVIAFLNSTIGADICETNLSACHSLKAKNGKSYVIIRVVSRKTKLRIFQNARKLKGTNVFVNDHLTKKRAHLATLARDLRKQKKIASTWMGKIFIKPNGTPEVTKVHLIKEMEHFRELRLI